MQTNTYIQRRGALRGAVAGGAILFIGNEEAPRNYPANGYVFRQDSHFLYYVGVNLPGMALLIEADGTETLFGAPEDPSDLIWHGPHPVLSDHAQNAGMAHFQSMEQLPEVVERLRSAGETFHFMPPYRADRQILLSRLLHLPLDEVAAAVSTELVRAVVDQRSIKTDEEIAQIEEALSVSARMYQAAFQTIRPGILESEVAGAMQGVCLRADRAQSFLPIVSIRGEVLHNNTYGNTLQDGDLLLVDSGTESPAFYASDITRTIPVSGMYSSRQREIYQVVLDAQMLAIESASPALTNKELHLIAARKIAEGLNALGLMKGDPADAVAAGAHALFFPHGLGHMIGLDVHDMEDLGDVVGYPENEQRSEQFGLSFLRMSRQFAPGFAITVEPGVYFIPALIDQWLGEKRHESFINYEEVQKYRDFGGVRIEDDLVITADGCRVLGPPIPKTLAEVEAAMRR